ncbi:hypothetical protein WICPIJ_008088 [Wickerhamomyces pijperi]|uniref:Uncharacterized protein n=1 Tax=Wickerhamomyces pijperi TaxID=599730 RepID=A0A9P8Q0B6_WICPI|nr:hypothetical protein WICPIJ_008088 [Wickerhamomyces pijperi]
MVEIFAPGEQFHLILSSSSNIRRLIRVLRVEDCLLQRVIGQQVPQILEQQLIHKRSAAQPNQCLQDIELYALDNLVSVKNMDDPICSDDIGNRGPNCGIDADQTAAAADLHLKPVHVLHCKLSDTSDVPW